MCGPEVAHTAADPDKGSGPVTCRTPSDLTDGRWWHERVRGVGGQAVAAGPVASVGVTVTPG